MKKSMYLMLRELLWLTMALVVTVLICRFLFSWDVSKKSLDLHLHDTYFVFDATAILLPAFLLITFLLYFIKEFRTRFARTLPNIILLITGLLTIIAVVVLNKELVKSGKILGGWTSYPPLSALPEVEPGQLVLNPITSAIANALTILQLAITTALVYAAFQCGKGTNLSPKPGL